MGRLPFDPGRMAAQRTLERSDGASKDAPITVGQLAALIDRTLKDGLPTGLKVVGEIGRFTPRTHWYFDLKDAAGAISCVMWRSSARKAGFEPAQGQQVVVTGRVEFYATQGRTQFIVDSIEPVGAGALDLAFRKLCEELRALGWMDEARKRPLPLLPRKVAVVTSRTGAALQDVLDTFARRSPCIDLALADVRVQGDGAAEEIARAIRRISERHAKIGVDVILVTRGGGSMEDLWAFNQRIVAEAIVGSAVPVVAAIGHEIDTTIAELVADVRGATPTQAAMRIAPDAGALRRQLGSVGGRLASMLARQIRLDSERLRSATRHSVFADPTRIVDEKLDDLRSASGSMRHGVLHLLRSVAARVDRAALTLEKHRPQTLAARRAADLASAATALHGAVTARLGRGAIDRLGEKLRAAMECAVREQGLRLDGTWRSLELVGPGSVLARGYSLTTDLNGRPIRSARDVTPGQSVRTRVVDGVFTSTVTGDGRPLTDAASVKPTKPRRRLVLDPGLNLFNQSPGPAPEDAGPGTGSG